MQPPQTPYAVRQGDDLLAYQTIRPTGGFWAAASVIIVLLILMLLCLILVPWQQSIHGIGRVSVYSPMDRPQPIEAPIKGRIAQWYVGEGQPVKEGQLLVELAEIDPKYLDPGQLGRLELQREALLARRAATETRIESLKGQSAFLSQSQRAAVPSAQVKTFQATNKIQAAKQALVAANQVQATAKLNLTRIQELHARGLRSTRDLELAIQTHTEAEAKQQQAKAYLDVAEQDFEVADFDQAKVIADTSASLSSIQASIASAYETLASTNSDLAKLEIELQNLRQRTAQRRITAPRAGILVRVQNVGLGETVSEGDALATLMPQSADQAVELLISDNDAPLLSVGRPVRLQFAGWPALQFSGWPAVAVGTFAGEVSVVDAIDDGTSRYRIWVKPDTKAIAEGKEQPWPSSRYLRPGSEAVGWVMLDTVPLWFELWRQFNAFPPTVSMDPFSEKGTDGAKGETKTEIKKPKKK